MKTYTLLGITNETCDLEIQADNVESSERGYHYFTKKEENGHDTFICKVSLIDKQIKKYIKYWKKTNPNVKGLL